MASLYCTNCGAQLHESALSCPSCGNLLQRSRPSAKSWFGFSGRIPRSTYWLQYELPVSLVLILLDLLPTTSTSSGILVLILFVASMWHSLAGNVKRAHDRGHSGWFLLLGLVPLVNIAVGVQLGFMRGDIGANQYGPDPLETPSAALASRANPQV